MRLPLVSFGLTALILLAGCAQQNGSGSSSSSLVAPTEVPVSDTTGGIRGIVVDQAIRPIAKAIVSIGGPEKSNVTTDDNGGFAVGNLKPGTYLLKASHPFYEGGQTTVEVEAGKEPPVTKIQLNQVIFGSPYLLTQKFKGFIECSIDFGGALFSEECGEGAGVECIMEPIPCGRVGGLESNQVQTDFFLPGDFPESLLVETMWTPSTGPATSGKLRVIVATDFVCDPFCGGNFIYDNIDDNCVGPPTIQRDDERIHDEDVTGYANLTTAVRMSHFVWACGAGDIPTVNPQLSQGYDIYVTSSYLLPLPEGWSFLGGSKDPFK